MQTIPVDGNEALVRMAFKEPVVLTQGGEEVAVVLCKTDYDRIMGKNLDRLRRLCDEVGAEAEAKGMTEEILRQILSDES